MTWFREEGEGGVRITALDEAMRTTEFYSETNEAKVQGPTFA